MNQRHGFRWLRAGIIGCLLAAILFSAALAATYPYETKCWENVNVRKSASESATVIKRVQAGEIVTVLGVSGKYYEIEIGGTKGYAVKQYVDGLSTGAETPPDTAGLYEAPSAISTYPYDTYTIAGVKFRKTASDTAEIISRIPEDAAVTVVSVDANGYAKIKYNGKTGFVNAGFLVLADIPLPATTAMLHPEAAKYEVLEAGSSGAAVIALQEALTELTYYQGEIDGKYGEQTKTAVDAFKKRNGLEQDGIADSEMQRFIFEGTPKNPKGYRKIIKTLPALPNVVISADKQGEQVGKLQERLQELGYYLGEISNVCDKATVQAIKDFQLKHSLEKTGIADTQTQTVLYGATALSAHTIVTPSPAPTVAPPEDTVRQGDRGDDAKAVQQRLKDLGYYTGKVDGKFLASSVEALKEFQTNNGLEADGVCGAITQAVLWAEFPVYGVPTAIPLIETTEAPITPETVITIRAGSRGNEVLKLQTRLEELGYYSSRLDGVYLEDDISAVRAFQKANALNVDGTAGYETQSLLFSDEAVRGSIDTIVETLRYGSAGNEVVALQARLIELGYLQGEADGKFGLDTKAALIAFQRASGLKRDGVAGSLTQETLYSDAAIRSGGILDTAEVLKEGTMSAAVTDLQNQLIALGYLSGPADGKFGSKTSLALMDFQANNNLVADGVAGKHTLESLVKANVVQADGSQAKVQPLAALNLTSAPHASNVRYANWYSEVKARCKKYPNVTVYDFVTGISWQANIFSFGAHAEAEPLTANDTANMNRAFGGMVTWTPKVVWVVFSDGEVYLASTHNTPHQTQHISGNDFNGHTCIHFPRTMSQVESIGPYATSHQKAIDLGWLTTQALARQ